MRLVAEILHMLENASELQVRRLYIFIQRYLSIDEEE